MALLNNFKPLVYDFLACPINIQKDIQDDILGDTQDKTRVWSQSGPSLVLGSKLL